MSNWVGYAVSVNCGEPLGCYQGTIVEADGTTISLTKPFRNGFPYPKSQVTLNAADIKELKIIEARLEPSEQTHSTVPVTKASKRGPRATVCENLQANHTGSPAQNGQSTSSGGNSGNSKSRNGGPARSKPIDIQGNNRNKNNNHNNHSGSYGAGGGGGGSGGTPRGRGGGGGGAAGGGGGGGRAERALRKNEACFGDAAHLASQPDFDFEKNLALFDKHALWEQMRAVRPDVVPPAPSNYGPHENVLGGGGAGGGAGPLRLPAELRVPQPYVTDAGALMECASGVARERLWAAMERRGLLDGALVLLARGAADVALRLVGGERRLEPRNHHQPPAVTVRLGAPARAARAGVAAARLLAAHGVQVTCALGDDLPPLADPLAPGAPLQASLAAGGVRLLPAGAGAGAGAVRAELALVCGAARAGGERAALLLEPEGDSAGAGVAVRACVWALAPGAAPGGCAHVYLVNVAPPPDVYAELGAAYRHPFAGSHLLPLHPHRTSPPPSASGL